MKNCRYELQETNLYQPQEITNFLHLKKFSTSRNYQFLTTSRNYQDFRLSGPFIMTLTSDNFMTLKS